MSFLRLGVFAMLLSATCASAQTLPLHEAVLAGDLETVTSQIKSGAALDARDSSGITALLIAVEKGETEIARVLIVAGADINAQAANKDTPWLLAGAAGRTEILAAMIPKNPDFSIRNRYGGNALIPACERGHVDTVKLLLRTKIDVNHFNDLGWTCLLEAVILGDGGAAHQDIVRLVLAAGANASLADKDGITPLVHAKARGQTEIATLIERAGGK
jgi:uncharacterized protein